MNFWWLQSAATWTGSGSSPIGNELLGPSVPHRALRPQLARRRGTFQRGTVSNRIRGTCTTFKHEKPPPKKDRSQSRPPSDRGRSPSRDRNDKKKKKKQPCKFRKRGFGNLVDRLQRDPFFQGQCREPRLGAGSIELHWNACRLHQPVINRTKSQILGEKLEMATKLVFVPSATRERDEPLDLHSEVFVSHCGVFFDIGQFAVYVAKFIKPKGRPLPLVYGWNDQWCRRLQRHCQGPCWVQQAPMDNLCIKAGPSWERDCWRGPGGSPTSCFGISVTSWTCPSTPWTVRAQLGEACWRWSLWQRSRRQRPAEGQR